MSKQVTRAKKLLKKAVRQKKLAGPYYIGSMVRGQWKGLPPVKYFRE